MLLLLLFSLLLLLLALGQPRDASSVFALFAPLRSGAHKIQHILNRTLKGIYFFD